MGRISRHAVFLKDNPERLGKEWGNIDPAVVSAARAAALAQIGSAKRAAERERNAKRLACTHSSDATSDFYRSYYDQGAPRSSNFLAGCQQRALSFAFHHLQKKRPLNEIDVSRGGDVGLSATTVTTGSDQGQRRTASARQR